MLPPLFCFVLFLLLICPSSSTVSGFLETSYSSPVLESITRMVWAPDGSGRLFLLKKNGTVLIAQSQNGEFVKSGANLAISVFVVEPVYANAECGLLGITFDPNYYDNRRVYLFVTNTSSKQQIVRYRDINNVGTQRVVLINNLPTLGTTRNGGALSFGPDGKLYFGIGDLGTGIGVNADLTSRAAKINRANPNGYPSNDNPFYDGVGPNDEYVWARGFRDPVSFMLQPSSWQTWVHVRGNAYQQIFTFGKRSHGGFSDYENNQTEGNTYITPRIAYRTNGVDVYVIASTTGAVRSGGRVTFTTTTPHRFRTGQKIIVAGVMDSSFNDANLYVANTPNATTLIAIQAGPDASSGGGSATTQSFGGALAGGVFYDSTLFPSEYRGNLFFGDMSSGKLVRSTFAIDGSIATVDEWGANFSSIADMNVGPDGAMYVVGASSQTITRITPLSSSGQRLIISALNLLIAEGGKIVFTVRLSETPITDVIVNILPSGDSDITILNDDSLTFNQTNWNQTQRVLLLCNIDADVVTEETNLTISSQGLNTEVVRVRSIDAPATFSPTTQIPTISPTTSFPTTVTPTAFPTASPTSATPTTLAPTSSPTTITPSTATPTVTPTGTPAGQILTCNATTCGACAVKGCGWCGSSKLCFDVSNTSNGVNCTGSLILNSSLCSIKRSIAAKEENTELLAGCIAGAVIFIICLLLFPWFVSSYYKRKDSQAL